MISNDIFKDIFGEMGNYKLVVVSGQTDMPSVL